MAQLGTDAVRRKRKRPTTASAKAEECPEDLVDREIAGWQAKDYMRDSLARDALTMALAAKYRAGEDLSGVTEMMGEKPLITGGDTAHGECRDIEFPGQKVTAEDCQAPCGC